VAVSAPVLRTPGIDGTLGPERFVDDLMQPAQVATSRSPKASWFGEALLSALAHRS
jgi:hypothetical protein